MKNFYVFNIQPLANNEKAAWTKLQPIGVNLKVDEKSFILYWRDANSKVNLTNLKFIFNLKKFKQKKIMIINSI